MLALISPAKKLDFETDTTITEHTQPNFLGCTEELVRTVRKLNRTQLASTMNLSDKLAELNFRRFKDFVTPSDLSNAKQAALVFNGDTYVGLQAGSLTAKDMAYAQDHLRILSGLYGLLRPLDLMQPYRMEMGTKFSAPGGTDLYGYWGRKLASAINEVTANHKDGTVINLASNEYFKAVGAKNLAQPVITPVFKEIKDGQARTLSMFAKRARGAMARFMIKKRIEKPAGLKKFTNGDYEYRDDLSDGTFWVFTRPQP